MLLLLLSLLLVYLLQEHVHVLLLLLHAEVSLLLLLLQHRCTFFAVLLLLQQGMRSSRATATSGVDSFNGLCVQLTGGRQEHVLAVTFGRMITLAVSLCQCSPQLAAAAWLLLLQHKGEFLELPFALLLLRLPPLQLLLQLLLLL